MKKANDLTAVILTKNEAEKLPRCLKSLDFVGQLIVVDDGSTDETLEIAKKAGAKIYERQLDDFTTQRNFALDKVVTEWVLMIDADEEVPPALAKEMMAAIKKKDFVGWQFPRKNLIFGQWVKHSGWYPDYQLHLFRTKRGKYVEKVHEQVKVEGQVGFLKNDLIHYNYDSISHFLDQRKFDQYSSLEAKQLVDSGYCFSWSDLVTKPMDEFLRRFFAEKGHEDGVLGLVLALFQAFNEFVIYAKVWERTKERERVEDLTLTAQVKNKLREKKKELAFWFLSEKARRETNFLKKLWLKLKAKIVVLH